MISQENMFAGLVLHLTLSVAFGIGFAVVTQFLRDWRLLIAAGQAYGLLLCVVNFQILGRITFPWFTNTDGPNQSFEILDHALFGRILVSFFFSLAVPARR